MKQSDLENNYLMSFYDVDTSRLNNITELIILKDTRAQIKCQLKNTTDELEKEKLEKRIQDITKQIEKLE